MAVHKRGYIITLNGKISCMIFSSGAHTAMIMEQMRLEHFEDIFGIELSAKTKSLEEQYEAEYTWDYTEHEALSSNDAEARCERIMRKQTEGE